MNDPTDIELSLPAEIDAIKERVRRAIFPIKPVDDCTQAEQHFLISAKCLIRQDELPPYYLLYFLLVDLLGFRDLGRFEKIAWSIPLDYEGEAFLVEHRKFGVGIFAGESEKAAESARKITRLLYRGVKEAKLFFEWKAKLAIKKSTLNVVNNGEPLYKRYEFFRDQFHQTLSEAEKRKDEEVIEEYETGNTFARVIKFPAAHLFPQASWLALAAIDAFFSWTEHIFIHISILKGAIKNGEEVADLAAAEWGAKFKSALGISDKKMKAHFDALVILRRQLRNFVAHGSFGKEGEAFSFHSGAGAVPVMMQVVHKKPAFSFDSRFGFEDKQAIETIEAFISYLWEGDRAPAREYIQESGLPLILTYANDGKYAAAISSPENMKDFIRYLCDRADQAANMDW